MVRWKLYTTRLFVIWNANDWGGERLEMTLRGFDIYEDSLGFTKETNITKDCKVT